jgi:hypothetical protein
MYNPIYLPSYTKADPFPHGIQDNFLNSEFAIELQREILNIHESKWDRYQNPFETKYTLRDKYAFPKNLKTLFSTLESPEFVSEISSVVGVPLVLDPTRNFWGVHKYNNGDKLDIHVDAGLHPQTKQKKQITLGIYLSSNWDESYGCKLELWRGTNAGLSNPVITEKVVEIAPIFNRLVLFTNNDYSWHGNPTPATCPENAKRIFITISYLSENYEDTNKRCKALFVARPDDAVDPHKDELRLLRADPVRYAEIYKSGLK